MMLYCFLAGLVFASSYCSAQVSLNTLNNRIEVLEKELEHGGRQSQSLSLNSKSHWLLPSFHHVSRVAIPFLFLSNLLSRRLSIRNVISASQCKYSCVESWTLARQENLHKIRCTKITCDGRREKHYSLRSSGSRIEQDHGRVGELR